MIEIEIIKQALEDSAQDGRSYENLVDNAQKWISSLITTIESQKEEIEQTRKRATKYLNSKIDVSNERHMLLFKNAKLKDEIESLKAITELAVKALRDVMEYDIEIGCYTSTAINAIKEIERLQNGTLS